MAAVKRTVMAWSAFLLALIGLMSLLVPVLPGILILLASLELYRRASYYREESELLRRIREFRSKHDINRDKIINNISYNLGAK